MQIEGVIKALRKFLPTEEEEAPATIFEIESQMREALAKGVNGKAKVQEIYDSKVIPLIKQAKKAISENSYHFSSSAAAAKGKAVQAGIGALKHLTENQSVISSNTVSAQQVFLLPKENAVFKRSTEKATEEERIINDLFDLMSENAVVGTFNIKSTSRKKFGIQIPIDIKQRGYLADSTNPTLRQAIEKKLSLKDLQLIKKYESSPQKEEIDFYMHANMAKIEFFIKHPKGDWAKVSFKELQKLYYADKLIEGTLIGSSEETAIPISEHISNTTVLFRSLSFNSALTKEGEKPLLTPDLNDQAVKRSYELCEKFKWSYRNTYGKICECNFKLMQANHLMNLSMHDIKCIPNKQNLQLPTSEDFTRALNVNWKAVSPELLKTEKHDITSLRDIQAKPFISGMVLMKDLTHEQREDVLKRLTPNSEFNSLLIGEVQ
ncbi:MAG: hypothetical protein H0W84_12675, partial [Bacteroidetes bacterium]|nr:hypothetical protein [Bacteroidota bacterium]